MTIFQFIPATPPEILYLHNSWTHLLFDTVLLVGTSYLGYFLISHPQRMAHNILGKATFQDGWENKVHQHAIRSITIITLVWLLWHIPYVIIEGGNLLYELIGLTEIIILAAIVKDMISQYRFIENAENPRVLETFDNVHFVTVLKGLFEAEGIRFCVQAFEYRRLFYFFEPLIKMRVLVDERDWEKANELADLKNVTII